MSPGQRETIESTLPAHSTTKRFTRIRQAGERVNDLLQLTGDHAPGRKPSQSGIAFGYGARIARQDSPASAPAAGNLTSIYSM
jgi:hypothetical protein